MAAAASEGQSAPSTSAPEAPVAGKPAVLIIGGLGTVLCFHLEMDQHY